MLFIIPPKVHLLDINGPAHIFYEAKEYGADIELHFVAMNDTTKIESSAGLHFTQLTPFHQFELNKNDFVFVPGIEFHLISNAEFIKKSVSFFKWLQLQHTNKATICSICTGTFLVAASGVLNGKSCTTHWKYFSEFNQKYPNIELKQNRLFVIEDNLYSSAGVTSGIDLALYILEVEFGTKLAADVAKEVVIYFRRSQSDPQLSIFLQYRNHLETRVHDIQDYISNHIHASFTLEDIAEHVNTSSRNLTRLFKTTTGITIGAYLEKLRVDRAIHLLMEGNKVSYVANQCGLKSANQLRNLLKKHQGILPKDILSN
ncbi:GlxA family transcriptional regulator [Aquimarina sp. 2201CG5-10]|uniref:GlxA family transcriptional regulator n=1 Tax=Aquimarina callyspongiae TaxID=3098150 RepID=UPI002AB3C601|nr:DJ-1/PfpI family protein [Aquimarina sp. 2201CG5-10]MDY8137313.1 DJ-1/PfpI family protein [Aquimarina sp. 2201CG5-10]